MVGIKFRALAKGGMIYSSKLGLDLFFATVAYEKLEPMQYIGLHDRNNVEVYEGDKVSAIYWFGREFDDWVEGKVVAKVCWCQGSLSFVFIENTTCKPQTYTLGRLDEIEVIGGS